MNHTLLSEKVFKRSDYLFFGFLTLLGFASIGYFMENWFSFRDYLYYPGTFSVMTLLLLFKLSMNQFRWFLLPYMQKPKARIPRPGWKVGVATTFVPGQEPIEMLEDTIKALVRMEYAHETWVLDEGDDAEVKALCFRLGVKHFSRKHLPQYQTKGDAFQSRSKYGNYNAWLQKIGFDRYEIIVNFDPDHVPTPEFLIKVLGHFEDPRVGYVQAAQVYYNQRASFIARGAAEETYPYYSCTQMASCSFGYPVVTGCHSSHRVEALKEMGGFPAHDAEDLLITLLYQARGWKGVYVPEILAKGLTPVDWDGYLTQQLRWARSVFDVKFKYYPKLAGKLPLTERVFGFLHGLSYGEVGITTFIGLILILSMLVTGISPRVVNGNILIKLAGLCVVLKICDLYRQRFYLDWKSERGLHWRAGLLKFAKWPFLLMALCDVVVGRRVPYALTRKVAGKSGRSMLFWPHAITAILICAACMTGILLGHPATPLLYLISAVAVTGSLGLILTELFTFPDPYDRHCSLSLEPSTIQRSEKEALLS